MAWATPQGDRREGHVDAACCAGGLRPAAATLKEEGRQGVLRKGHGLVGWLVGVGCAWLLMVVALGSCLETRFIVVIVLGQG